MATLPFYGHVIDGEISGATGRTFDTIDPWTREPWAKVAFGTADDAERALRAARRAFDEGPWGRMSHAERARTLNALADALEQHVEALSALDSQDMGRPRHQIRRDVARSSEMLRFFAADARLAPAETLDMDGGEQCSIHFPPAGVVVAITPWNFPLLQAVSKIAPALAWGNTMVLKPAEQSPTSATLLATLALEAGVPPGVMNVVQGFGETVGQALTQSPLTDRIAFTGETATGRTISRAAADNLTPVSLELGGKGANIIFEDADLSEAVPTSVRAIFGNSGQVCLAGSRIFVQRPIYERFLNQFVKAAEALVVGDPQLATTDLGPLASREQFDRVVGFLQQLNGSNGRTLTGGAGTGWVVHPTVVVDAPPSSPIAQREVFGPVVVVDVFDHEDEAIRLANDCAYGLSAMLFTQDLGRAHRVSAAMRAGIVWVNTFLVRDMRAPFGGAGDSGVGRQGGTFSRDFFTEPQAVVVQL